MVRPIPPPHLTNNFMPTVGEQVELQYQNGWWPVVVKKKERGDKWVVEYEEQITHTVKRDLLLRAPDEVLAARWIGALSAEIEGNKHSSSFGYSFAGLRFKAPEGAPKDEFCTSLSNDAEDQYILSASPLKRIIVRVGVPPALFRRLSPYWRPGSR